MNAATATKRTSQREVLRDLLLTGQWFSNAYLSSHVGLRFGARLLELRRGADGNLPMVVELRHLDDAGSLVEYRFVGYGTAPEPIKTKAAIVAELRLELALAREALARANEALSQRKPYSKPVVTSMSRSEFNAVFPFIAEVES